jgi:hypothetical protein
LVFKEKSKLGILEFQKSLKRKKSTQMGWLERPTIFPLRLRKERFILLKQMCGPSAVFFMSFAFWNKRLMAIVKTI